MSTDPRGQFVWHELLTTDAAAATAFYTKVIAWKTQPWEHDASYSMWVARNGFVGGVSALGESGAPHWVPYIGVNDVTAAIETASSLGGKVLNEPAALPSGGTHALLADPQGAEFGIYSSPEQPNGAGGPAPGDFSWHELVTTDAEAALAFYTELFGWERGPVHDMQDGKYYLFNRDGQQYGGVYEGPEGTAPSWLCYVSVEDAGKAAAAVKAAGGRVLNGPMEVPGGSWIVQVLDGEGAAFAVHEPRLEKKPTAKAVKLAKPTAPKVAKVAKVSATPAQAEPVEAPAKVSAAAPARKAAARPGKKTRKAAAKPAAKAAAKKSKTKKASRKAAPAKGRPARGKAAKKVVKKKAAAKGRARAAAKSAAGKKKSAARRAPAKKKKASRAKAKKRR